MNALVQKHWRRMQRSLGRRYREWRLPRGYERFGTRYGGWWIDTTLVGRDPLVVDAGLGADISFPSAFLARFGGQVMGIDPNPQSIRYVEAHKPPGMQVLQNAFWRDAGEDITFHMPRALDQLPKGADGVSGSVLSSHSYTAGGTQFTVKTTSLDHVLSLAGRNACDILKMDIEGAEYDVLAALCRTGAIRKATQVLIEFHHHCTDHPLADTLNTVALVQQAGFQLVYTEDRNYIFKRLDA